MSGAKGTKVTLGIGVVLLGLALLVSFHMPVFAEATVDDYAGCHGRLIIPEGASLLNFSVKAEHLKSDSNEGKTYNAEIRGDQWFLTVPPGTYQINIKWAILFAATMQTGPEGNQIMPSPWRLPVIEGEESVGPLTLKAGDDLGFTHKITRRSETAEPKKLLITAPSAVTAGKEFTIKVTSLDGGEAVPGAKVYLLPRHVFTPKTPQEENKPSKAPIVPIPVPIPVPTPKPVPLRPVLLGETNDKGELASSISVAGRHFLRAEKEGFTPAVTSIFVEKGSNVRFFTDKTIYRKGEEVLLVLYNGSSGPLTLTNTAPWKIFDAKGDLVFAPMAAQVIMTLNPGETRTWVWSQRDGNSNPVPSGAYTAQIRVSGADYQARFNIVSLRWKGVPVPKPSMPAASPFRDVTGEVDWADPYILSLHQQGIVKGKEEGVFAPNDTLSRAEFLALLMRSLKLAPSGEKAIGGNESGGNIGISGSVVTGGTIDVGGPAGISGLPGAEKISSTAASQVPFSDVPLNHWARAYIAEALRLGLLEPDEYPLGFGPDAPITRQEMAVLAVRAMGLDSQVQLAASENASQALPFKDAGEIYPDWLGYVKTAVEWDILNGYGDNTFRPQGQVRRQEAAVVIFRLMGED